jgi:LysR family transcriptional regulator, glycine cleavage system transcriptional activator
MREAHAREFAGNELPPLNALRTFEAAARHLSFKKAAVELHVSPTAVSHQIRTLEEYLQVRLFRRLHRALELTDEAQAALPKLREGFQCLVEAVEALRRRESIRTLSISAPPALVTRWLVPRLRRFVARHPDIDVRVAATMHSVDGRHAEAEAIAEPTDLHDAAPDVEIRFGAGHYPGFRVEKLLSAWVTPVCSPRLLQGEHALKSPEDLRHHALLHDDALRLADDQAEWAVWLDRAGVTNVDATRGPHFSHAALVLDAAADGLGVALTLGPLAATDLATGRLIAPFELRIPLSSGYYVVCQEIRADQPHIAAVREWLLAEAKATGRGAGLARRPSRARVDSREA